MTLQELITEGKSFESKAHNSGYEELTGEPIKIISGSEYETWKSMAHFYLENNHPGTSAHKEFKKIINSSDNPPNSLNNHIKMIGILNAISQLSPSKEKIDIEQILTTVFDRFFHVAKQLSQRYKDRDTLAIEDEYDVQDLLHSILRLYFDDIRDEEPIPSNAGSSKRIDFLLPDQKIGIEVKIKRESCSKNKLGDELKIDILSYSKHQDCKALYCFVYDPESKIKNPRSIENDLSHEYNGFPVKVFIRPKI